jgi:Ca2+-dependent lipid-binding protein
MPNQAEFLELELKTGFLILFGSVCGLLFGTVGLIMAGICFLILLHVLITFNRHDKRKNAAPFEIVEAKPTEQAKEADEESESNEVDDLLLLLDPI